MDAGTVKLRTSPVKFIEEGHRYILGDKELKGITSTLVHRAFPNALDGIPEEVLNRAAEYGHRIHEELMNIERWKQEPESVEAANYIIERDKLGLRSIDSEYIVSDEKDYASAIDNVSLNEYNEICLIDYKTFYQLDAERRQKVTLQLSIYKVLFELTNPDLTVDHLYVAWFREASNGSHREFIELPFVGYDVVACLLDADRNDKEDYVYNPLPEWIGDFEVRYLNALKRKAVADQEVEELKQELYESMHDEKLGSFKSPFLTVSYIEGGKSTRFDADKFKKDNPETYQQYQKESVRKPSLRIVVNKAVQ